MNFCDAKPDSMADCIKFKVLENIINFYAENVVFDLLINYFVKIFCSRSITLLFLAN